MNSDSGFRRDARQQNLQIAPAQRNAPGGRCQPRSSDVDKYSAAPAGDTGPRIVVNFDHKIIEIIGSAQTVA
jgi:hypothetical protein